MCGGETCYYSGTSGKSTCKAFSIVFFLFMDLGNSGDLRFYILKGRPKGWKGGGGLIRGWKFPKDLVLLVGL